MRRRQRLGRLIDDLGLRRELGLTQRALLQLLVEAGDLFAVLLLELLLARRLRALHLVVGGAQLLELAELRLERLHLGALPLRLHHLRRQLRLVLAVVARLRVQHTVCASPKSA